MHVDRGRSGSEYPLGAAQLALVEATRSSPANASFQAAGPLFPRRTECGAGRARSKSGSAVGEPGGYN